MTLLAKYEAWVLKLCKTLKCTKGQEGAILASRFSRLSMGNSLLEHYYYAKMLRVVVEDFSQDRKNLRWVEKLTGECERWDKVFESTLRVANEDASSVLTALVEGKIDIDLAVGLYNG